MSAILDSVKRRDYFVFNLSIHSLLRNHLASEDFRNVEGHPAHDFDYVCASSLFLSSPPVKNATSFIQWAFNLYSPPEMLFIFC